MFAGCCGLCAPTVSLSHDDMVYIERALGNIKTSHKAITLAGLVSLGHGRAQFVHYLTGPAFAQIY